MRKNIFLIIIGFISAIQVYSQQSKSGPNRPTGVNKGTIKNNFKHQAATIISGVPAYLWHRGCGPTSLGMLIGYYDTHGLSDLIDGDASTQTSDVDDAIANDEHYSDYSLPLDEYPNLEQDKSELGGAHASNCIADFMETSWSSESNYWGWSWSNMIDNAFRDYVNMQNSEYETYETYEYFSDSTSWNVFTKEIDNNRPVILLVDSDGDGKTDHFVTGIGYDESDTTYAIYDTWDRKIHLFKWREISENYSWGIYGFNILKFQFNVSASANLAAGGTVGGADKYDFNQTASMTATASTGYEFVNWTENGVEVSTNANYSFLVTENRTLVANFASVTSIVDLEKSDIISIYPNPVFDKMNIEVGGNNSAYSFEIINANGQIIFKGNFVGKTSVQTDEFVSGIYLIKFKNEESCYFKKIIKE